MMYTIGGISSFDIWYTIAMATASGEIMPPKTSAVGYCIHPTGVQGNRGAHRTTTTNHTLYHGPYWPVHLCAPGVPQTPSIDEGPKDAPPLEAFY